MASIRPIGGCIVSQVDTSNICGTDTLSTVFVCTPNSAAVYGEIVSYCLPIMNDLVRFDGSNGYPSCNKGKCYKFGACKIYSKCMIESPSNSYADTHGLSIHVLIIVLSEIEKRTPITSFSICSGTACAQCPL